MFGKEGVGRNSLEETRKVVTLTSSKEVQVTRRREGRKFSRMFLVGRKYQEPEAEGHLLLQYFLPPT